MMRSKDALKIISCMINDLTPKDANSFWHEQNDSRSSCVAILKKELEYTAANEREVEIAEFGVSKSTKVVYDVCRCLPDEKNRPNVGSPLHTFDTEDEAKRYVFKSGDWIVRKRIVLNDNSI